MSWIQFTGEVNEVNLAKAKVGDQISLRADSANELRGRKKELRKSAKALKMKLRWEKDEERIEMGTRPGTEGLWRNSRGHYAYARIMAREVPLSPHGWDRPAGWGIDYDSTELGAGTGVDLAVAGESPDGFRPAGSNRRFGPKMGIREGGVHVGEEEAFENVLLGDATWVRRRAGSIAERRRLRSALEQQLGRRLYTDEEAVDNNGEIVLTSRGW